VRLANDSQYGLGASIWTEALDKAEKLSRMVRSGIVTVNNVVASDPRVPFGGVKKSGFGVVIKVWNVRGCQCQINQIL
jgi:succinate-semialdehyde dehydrogenase/glutarate-semialdehyde dehydrogenase/succinyl-CoA reductase